jgi:integrase
MKKLCRKANREDILHELNKLDVFQTEFLDLQSITLDEFLKWRDEVLGITASLPVKAHLDIRQSWLWVFSMQVVYGLRIHEVFAIQNLDEPFTTKDKKVIPALSDPDNIDNAIVVGEKTAIGTTTKTGYRLARPIIPPAHPDLIRILEVKMPLVPLNAPTGNSYRRASDFYCTNAAKVLRKWNAPFTQTHALRHLANINGMQAGIPLEVRAQSLGHTPAMNDSTYKSS